jgi:uracil-DNA glycosylase
LAVTRRSTRGWDALNARIVDCRRCERLLAHCRHVAEVKRRSFCDWTYWGRPVPNFGDPGARLLLIGLAPAAHGANRTGRMFTGDRSGDFLFRALFETGFASQPAATDAGDGLVLRDAAITAAVHCAPPANRPSAEELDACFSHLLDTVAALRRLRVIVVLGGVALASAVRLYRTLGWAPMRPRPEFGHGRIYRYEGAPLLICAYHPSQQNTFTGRLTPAMLRDAFRQARRALQGS